MEEMYYDRKRLTTIHSGHKHPLDLVDLQPKYPEYEEEYEDEEDEWITKWDFRSRCHLCSKEINLYHRYYYNCSHGCDNFSLHKFCGDLPATLEHSFYDNGKLEFGVCKGGLPCPWKCAICRSYHEPEEVCYYNWVSAHAISLKCVMRQGKNLNYHDMIYHPSHPHPLSTVNFKPFLGECDACGKRHMGIFYHCTTCFGFSIHTQCAFLPKKLQAQHTHPLNLSYSFPINERRENFNPKCRICALDFEYSELLWIYKCEKCRYYVHLHCATSREEPFMSIFLSAGAGGTSKNFKDEDHGDLVHLPFPDQTYSILQQKFSNKNEGNLNLKHISHQHLLCLTSSTSDHCHNPMKRVEVLCNGCIRPIMTMPFYKCTKDCNFFLHDWCTQLPAEIQNHPDHPQHTLVFLPNVSCKFFHVFGCQVCYLSCNGFAYGCIECDYYIDISCGFIPEKIVHEAHPHHLLLRAKTRADTYCGACLSQIFRRIYPISFRCITCEFNLHPTCALSFPRRMRHKLDKHPMNLRYLPIENHKSKYFCEVCEEEMDPNKWFYHCDVCVQSMHRSCVPVIRRYEEAHNDAFLDLYDFLNIKFGGIHNMEGHPHALSFAQGIEGDGRCTICKSELEGKMIFKCSKCKFAIDYYCCSRLSQNPAI